MAVPAAPFFTSSFHASLAGHEKGAANSNELLRLR
jgi:hypothetical protein